MSGKKACLDSIAGQDKRKSVSVALKQNRLNPKLVSIMDETTHESHKYISLILRMSLSKNVTTLDELEELLPGYSGLQRQIGRIMKYAL